MRKNEKLETREFIINCVYLIMKIEKIRLTKLGRN